MTSEDHDGILHKYLYIYIKLKFDHPRRSRWCKARRSCLLVAPPWPKLELINKVWGYRSCGSQYDNKGGITESDNVLVYIPIIN